MIGFFIFVTGLMIGSFLNVCIYRIPKGESVNFPPSHCTNCNTRIKWYDLIPILSYIFLGGKCRNCKQKISIRYPLIELITGAVFIALYIKYGLTFTLIKYLVLACLFIVIGMIDFDTTDVYDSVIITGCIIVAIIIISGFFMKYIFLKDIINYLLGALLGGGIISLIVIITGGMGWGDAEICALCGLYFGWALTGEMLMISFIIGGTAGIILILTKKKTRKDYIPFGPYISIAGLIIMFFGQALLNWYISAFIG